MDLAIFVIVLLVTLWFFHSLIKSDNDNSENEFIIKQPKIYYTISVGSTLLLGICGLGALISEPNLSSAIVIAIGFFIYSSAGGFLILFFKNWKIELYDDGFIYTNMFAKKRKVFFDDVTLKDTGKGCFVYDKNGKRIVGVSYLQPNSDALEKVYNDYMKTKRKNKSKSV